MSETLPPKRSLIEPHGLISRCRGVLTVTTATQLLSGNWRRVRLLISPVSTGDLFLGNDSADLTANLGFSLAPNGTALVLDYYRDGSCVQQPWFHLSSAGGNSFGLIEVIYRG